VDGVRTNGVLHYILIKMDSLEAAMTQGFDAVNQKVNIIYADHEVRKAQKEARRQAWHRTLRWIAQAAIYVVPVVAAALLGVNAIR